MPKIIFHNMDNDIPNQPTDRMTRRNPKKSTKTDPNNKQYLTMLNYTECNQGTKNTCEDLY